MATSLDRMESLGARIRAGPVGGFQDTFFNSQEGGVAMKAASPISMLLVLFVLGCAVVGTACPVQAQDGQPVRVILKDGSRLVGTIFEDTEDAIQFRTASGVEMTIPRDQLEKIEVLDETFVRGRFLRTDPNRTRLFFAPTARSLGNGRGYFALYEVFIPYVSVGVGNVATLGGGISLIPGAEEQLLYGAAKFTFVERGNAALAAGGFIATLTAGGGYGGSVFGVGTFGRPDAALSLGLGFAYGEGEFEESPAVIIGGEYQVSDNVKLLSENYVIPAVKDAVIVSGGIRFIGERLAADLALFTVPALLDETEGFPFLPWISFAYNFGGGSLR